MPVMCNEQSLNTPLTKTFLLTQFGDMRATEYREIKTTLKALGEKIESGAFEAKDKASQPHLKLTKFSGKTTPKGCYRHNGAAEYRGGRGNSDQSLRWIA